MKDVIIIDNFLDDLELDKLKDYFITNQNKLTWYYHDNINYQNLKENPLILTNPSKVETKKNDGFVIVLNRNETPVSKETQRLIEQIREYAINKLGIKVRNTIRIKINLNKPQTLDLKDIDEGIHVDNLSEHITLIYYVNTNDGYTILYENDKKTIKHKIDCVGNRLVVFDGLTPHVGVPSTKIDKFLINFNLIEKKTNTKFI
jgi:hypothetical protein